MVEIGEQVMQEIAGHGNCVIVGRGAPYHLRERRDAFHVFMYAPRAEKLRRIQKQGKSLREAERLSFVLAERVPDGATIGFDLERDRSLYHVTDSGIVVVEGHRSTVDVATILV